jgi:hypothetical protein
MPDISMCKGDDCPQKEDCYRFTATPSEFRQAYLRESPYSMDGCQYFMYNSLDNIKHIKEKPRERTI